MQLGLTDPRTGWDGGRFSLPQFQDWKSQSRAFSDMATYYYTIRNLTGSQGPQQTTVGVLSANMFSVLDAQPLFGRTFRSDEGGPAGENVVVVGEGLWRTRYGGDRDILGQTIMLDGIDHTVIGVMPRRFNFPFGTVKLWVPNHDDPVAEARDRDVNIIVARLNSGWSVARAREELTSIQSRLAQLHPDADGLFDGVSVKPIREALNFAYDILRITFALLLSAVVFALIIACVNVASLTLARNTARTSEVAVRTALGAGRGRLVRQLFTESALLAVVGGVLGVFAAHVGAKIIGGAIPEDLFRIGDASIDGTVLLFTLAVTLVTAVVFGLIPAFSASKTDLTSALKEGGRAGQGVRSMRVRRSLVVFEMAMAVVLLSGMGLMARSLAAVQNVDLGFTADSLLTVAVTPPVADYPEIPDYQNYFDRATAQAAALPGIRGVARAVALPLNHATYTLQFARVDRSYDSPKDWPVAIDNRVSRAYFATMRIDLLNGRTFTTTDGRDAPKVVIVSQTLAERYWPGESPLGRSLLVGSAANAVTSTVVGVVADVRYENLSSDPRPQIYRPVTQAPGRRQFLVLRTAGAPGSLVGPVRRMLLGMDGNLPVSVRPMTDILQENTLQWAISSLFLAILGAAALFLASLGVYGVVSYSVAQRRREIGVRMALGATDVDIRHVFLREGLKLAGLGLGIGLVLALAAGKAMTALLFEVGSFDPVTFGGVVVMFAGVVLAASVVPARRASRVDPLTALRSE